MARLRSSSRMRNWSVVRLVSPAASSERLSTAQATHIFK